MGEVGQAPATTDSAFDQLSLNEQLAEVFAIDNVDIDEGRVRSLLLAGASPNTVIKGSITVSGHDTPVIHEALDSGEADIIKLLLDAGANPNVEDGKYGLSVLEMLFCFSYDCTQIETCLDKGARLFRPERLRTSRWKSWFRVIAQMVARQMLNKVSLDLKIELIEVMLNRCLEIAIAFGDSSHEEVLHDLIRGLIMRDDFFTLEKFERYLNSRWFGSAAFQPGGDYKKCNLFIMCDKCLEVQKECETCQSWDFSILVRLSYKSLAEMVVNEVEEFRPEVWDRESATTVPASVGSPEDDIFTSSDEEPPRKVARKNYDGTPNSDHTGALENEPQDESMYQTSMVFIF